MHTLPGLVTSHCPGVNFHASLIIGFLTGKWMRHWINNGTEQVIGRMKVRSKTVQDCKTESGMLTGILVARSGVN